MVRYQVVTLLAACAVVVGAQTDYCRISPKHTLCLHQGPGAACDQMQESGVSPQEAKYIVAEHNNLRAKVANGRESRGSTYSQPSAADMRQMEWDDELARVAQRHAEQCLFQHDCRDCKRVARFKVGQNLYSSSSTRLDSYPEWKRAIYAWFDEVAIFSPQHIEPFIFATPIGHYTQLVWAHTYKVGCGYTLYKEGPWWTKLYVCDYGPVGNYPGGQMYQQGTSCSACPGNTVCSKEYPGLCTNRANNAFVPNKRPVTLPPGPQLVTWEPSNTAGQQLFHCDLDHAGCRVKYQGTTWKIIETNSKQGRIFGTAVSSGRTTELTFDQLVAPPRGGTLCLQFAYMKYELRGGAIVDLVVSLEPLSGSGQRTEVVEQENARGEMRQRSVQLAHVFQPFQLRFVASVPAWAFGQTTVVALDQVRVVSGTCEAAARRQQQRRFFNNLLPGWPN